MDPFLVFSTPAYDPLRTAICRVGRFDRGSITTRRFPDGERYTRIDTRVDGRDVVLVGGTISDGDTLELFDIACGLVRYGAKRLSIAVPYFGYSTMDRATKLGEVVTAKNRARLLSSIPVAAFGNRVFCVDLHTEGLPHYFEDGTRAVHLYARDAVMSAARRLGGDDFVLACTDAGRAKWVESLANDLGVSASFVFKRRLDGRNTEVTAVSAQVSNRRVVIYDDMIRTGGSLLGAAAAYLDAGASSVDAIATHGVFPEGALERIHDAGLFGSVVVTDSHPRALEAAKAYPDFLEVMSLAELFVSSLGQYT